MEELPNGPVSRATGNPPGRIRRSMPVADASSVAPPKRSVVCFFPELLDLDPPPEPVFGQYPRAFLDHVAPLMNCSRRRIVHVCSGCLPKGEGIRVDMRPAARPDILADGRALPFRDGSVDAVLIDPPYTREYARDLYGVEYPVPAQLLREAARVVRPQGRIGFVHFMIPNTPPGCRMVKVLALATGCGYALRAVTIYEREPASLFPARDPLDGGGGETPV